VAGRDTAAGYLSHKDGVFSMAEGQAELFRGQALPFDPTVLFLFHELTARLGPDVERAIRDGQGVPYDRYQPEFSAAQDAMNAPLYEQFLLSEWIPSVEGLDDRLTTGASMADVGCGGGRALCLLAAAYPASTFTGIDIDDAGLEIGRARAAEAGLSNVTFVKRDAAALGERNVFDAVIAVDAIHDQADPTSVLRCIREVLRPDGVFVMVEPTASGDLDTDIAQPTAVMGYATSLLHCVQVSMAGGGPGLGGMWGNRGAQTLFAETDFTTVTRHESPSDYTVFAARP
jgi:ubiquinone/menaquinone biosynthesis C-methylase UbiE